MKPTPERGVDEIVEEFKENYVSAIDDELEYGFVECNAKNVVDWLTQTLTAERQRCDEMVEAEKKFWEQIVANQKVEIEMLRVKPDKQIFITQPNKLDGIM